MEVKWRQNTIHAHQQLFLRNRRQIKTNARMLLIHNLTQLTVITVEIEQGRANIRLWIDSILALVLIWRRLRKNSYWWVSIIFWGVSWPPPPAELTPLISIKRTFAAIADWLSLPPTVPKWFVAKSVSANVSLLNEHGSLQNIGQLCGCHADVPLTVSTALAQHVNQITRRSSASRSDKSPVYTIQPVVKPVVKPVRQPVWQPAVSCIQPLSNRL